MITVKDMNRHRGSDAVSAGFDSHNVERYWRGIFTLAGLDKVIA